MKKNILRIIVVAFSTHVMAENMPSVCQDLVNVDLHKKTLEPNDKIKSGLYDINNDGIEEKVVIDSLREELPLELSLYNKKTNNSIFYGAYEHVRFDESLEVFNYHNKYYIQHYRTKAKTSPTYVTYINSENKEIPICKFKNVKKLILKEDNTTFDKLKCNALLKRYKEGESVIFDIPSKFKFDVTRKYGFYAQKTHIGNIAYFDYNNDGYKEYVQLFQDKYGTYLFYREIKDNMKILMDNVGLDVANNIWLRYQDKVYFVNGKIDSLNNLIAIGMIEDNRNKLVCTYDLNIEVTVDRNQTKLF